MKFFAVLFALLLPLAALSAGSQQVPNISIIQVPPGPGGATVTSQAGTGQASSANPALYYVAGTYGQTLSASVTAAGNNAFFQIYHPDTTVALGANGQPVITGRTLPDAGVGGAKSGSTAYSLTATLQ